MTQAEIARRLGLKHGNVVSMIMNPDNATRLAVNRLPSLQEACGFSNREAVRLFLLHAKDYPTGGELDAETAKWIVSCVWRVSRGVVLAHA